MSLLTPGSQFSGSFQVLLCIGLCIAGFGAGFKNGPAVVVDFLQSGTDFIPVVEAFAEVFPAGAVPAAFFEMDLANPVAEGSYLFLGFVMPDVRITHVQIDIDRGRADSIEDVDVLFRAQRRFETETDSRCFGCRRYGLQLLDGGLLVVSLRRTRGNAQRTLSSNIA